jgi:hypothetical protein
VILEGGCEACRLVGNTFTGNCNERALILGSGSQRCQVVANTFDIAHYQAGTGAIKLNGADVVHGSTGHGEHVVVGNRISGDASETAGEAAIVLVRSDHNVVIGNVIRDFGTGLRCDGVGNMCHSNVCLGVGVPTAQYTEHGFVQEIVGATPTLPSGRVFRTANAAVTTMTDLLGGAIAEPITVVFGDNNTTVDFSGTGLSGNDGAPFEASAGDFMMCVHDGSKWRCTVTKC